MQTHTHTHTHTHTQTHTHTITPSLSFSVTVCESMSVSRSLSLCVSRLPDCGLKLLVHPGDVVFQSVSERPTPPLPYRIAKALDPALYRNVELDIVHEEKRGELLTIPTAGWGLSFCMLPIPTAGWGLSFCMLTIPTAGWGLSFCMLTIPTAGWGLSFCRRPSLPSLSVRPSVRLSVPFSLSPPLLLPPIPMFIIEAEK